MVPIKGLLTVCVSALLLGATTAKVAEHTTCEDVNNSICSVDEVRIVPCISPSLCALKKGSPASISFDFTPNFSASKFKTGLFWASDAGDVKFPDLTDADACEMTGCPSQTGQQQQFNYSLKISRMFPKGKFVFKWKVWNADDETQVCCFMTKIRLT